MTWIEHSRYVTAWDKEGRSRAAGTHDLRHPGAALSRSRWRCRGDARRLPAFARHDSASSGGVRGFVIDVMTPESETSTPYFWGMARDFDVHDRGLTARFKTQQGGVFLKIERKRKERPTG